MYIFYSLLFYCKKNLENFIFNKYIYVPSVLGDFFVKVHAKFLKKNDSNICFYSVP